LPGSRQQEAIRHARKLKAKGMSLRAISAVLRERGHSLSHVAISNMLRTERAGDNESRMAIAHLWVSTDPKA